MDLHRKREEERRDNTERSHNTLWNLEDFVLTDVWPLTADASSFVLAIHEPYLLKRYGCTSPVSSGLTYRMIFFETKLSGS